MTNLKYGILMDTIIKYKEQIELINSMKNKLGSSEDGNKCYLSVLYENNDQQVKTKYLDISDYNLRYTLKDDLNNILSEAENAINLIINELQEKAGTSIRDRSSRKKFEVNFSLDDTILLYYICSQNKPMIEYLNSINTKPDSKISFYSKDIQQETYIVTNNEENNIISEAINDIYNSQLNRLDEQLCIIHNLIDIKLIELESTTNRLPLISECTETDYITAFNVIAVAKIENQ